MKTAIELTDNLTTAETHFVMGWITQAITDKGVARTKDVRKAVEAAKANTARRVAEGKVWLSDD